MLSGDCQSQGLAEWLRSLGWRGALQPSDLRKLNTPKMRSIWRHLQAQVVPTHVASTIRKNVLLAKLEEDNIFVGQFRNFKVDSINQLCKVKNILKIEEEKDRIKEEIRMVYGQLQNEKSSLLQNNVVVEWERNKLNEIEDKTAILELKLGKILKDCKKMNEDKETVVNLKSFKSHSSHNELNYQKSLVCKYVKNYRYPFEEGDDDSDYLCEMMVSILEFKPGSILDGISQTVKEALSLLNPKVDLIESVETRVSSEKVQTFREKLRELKILIVRNELHIRECTERIESESNELDKEKVELIRQVQDNGRLLDNGDKSGSYGLVNGNLENGGEEFVQKIDVGGSINISKNLDTVLEKIYEEGFNKKISKAKHFLMPHEEIEPVEVLKQSVNILMAKEEELWKEVEKKVSEINRVTSTIFCSLIDSGELNELVTEISQVASDLKNKSSQIHNSSVDYRDFTEMILKEVEVFQGIPMIALQRKWDTGNEMLRVSAAKKFSNNQMLHQFLSQSEDKNLTVNILEKYLWSLYINPQFH